MASNALSTHTWIMIIPFYPKKVNHSPLQGPLIVSLDLTWRLAPYSLPDTRSEVLNLYGGDRIVIAFTSVWIDFLFCSHVAGYNSYPDKLYADRPCVHTYPSLSYLDKAVHMCLGSENCSPDEFVLHFQRRINILRTEKGTLSG